MSQQQSTKQGQTLREMSAPKKQRKLPPEARIFGNIVLAVQSVALWFYATGWITFTQDGFDKVIATAAICTCVMSFLLFNGSIKYLEDV